MSMNIFVSLLSVFIDFFCFFSLCNKWEAFCRGIVAMTITYVHTQRGVHVQMTTEEKKKLNQNIKKKNKNPAHKSDSWSIKLFLSYIIWTVLLVLNLSVSRFVCFQCFWCAWVVMSVECVGVWGWERLPVNTIIRRVTPAEGELGSLGRPWWRVSMHQTDDRLSLHTDHKQHTHHQPFWIVATPHHSSFEIILSFLFQILPTSNFTHHLSITTITIFILIRINLYTKVTSLSSRTTGPRLH